MHPSADVFLAFLTYSKREAAFATISHYTISVSYIKSIEKEKVLSIFYEIYAFFCIEI